MAGKKWQRLIGDNVLGGIYPALEAMTDNELRNVRSAPKKMTSRNCWWLTHRFAPTLAEIADDILRMRYAARRKKKTPNDKASTKYAEMDRRILEAVAKRSNPHSDPRCVEEGKRIADEERAHNRYYNFRPGYRVIDGRLQALRKAGKIKHYTKAEKSGAGGWHLVPIGG